MSDAVTANRVGTGARDVASVRLPPLVAYPERLSPRRDAVTQLIERCSPMGWLERRHGGSTRRLRSILPRVAILSLDLEQLDDAALAGTARAAGLALRRHQDWPEHGLAALLAAVAEAARRRLGQRPYDVQLLGAHAILRGFTAEMATGEGKTLVAILAAAVAGLAGIPVHVVTVNRYLAERDAEFARPLYGFLGLTVAVVTEAVPLSARTAAYRCDIVHCVNKDLAFDYMRDRLGAGRRVSNLRRKAGKLSHGGSDAGMLLRGLHFAIVDEADSVLIDEARTPLVLSRGEQDRDTDSYRTALGIAATLSPGSDYLVRAGERRIVLLAAARPTIALALGPDAAAAPWDQPEERDRLIVQALTALHLLVRDEHYLVRDGRIEIIDEYTGRVLADRNWSDGLQEMVECKEGLELTVQHRIEARMTYQRFFRRYRRLSGLSGTLGEVAGEIRRVYGLRFAAIPPHRPDAKRFHRRRAFATSRERWAGLVRDVAALHRTGAPVLIGTRTVAASLEASRALASAGLDHVVLSAAQDEEEAAIIARAGLSGAITVATNMAGRGTDIRIPPDVLRTSGGLRVVLSEPQEARRIDRQLAGRSGRQGEPGEVLSYVSLEDALLAAHSPALLRAAARSASRLVGMAPIRWLCGWSQRRSERVHARMRGALLRIDDFMDDSVSFAGEVE